MFKRSHIDAAHEVRMWITQVIIPIAALVFVVPENRQAIKQKISGIKNKYHI